jgi:hypothetical protein
MLQLERFFPKLQAFAFLSVTLLSEFQATIRIVVNFS